MPADLCNNKNNELGTDNATSSNIYENPETGTQRKRQLRFKHPVWDHFSEQKDGRFKCNYCQISLTPPPSSTSAKRHLERYHKKQF